MVIGTNLALLALGSKKENLHADPLFQCRDNMTVENWITNTLWTADARECMRVATAQVLGCEARHASFLYFLYYVRTAGGVTALVEVRL